MNKIVKEMSDIPWESHELAKSSPVLRKAEYKGLQGLHEICIVPNAGQA